MFVFLSLLQKQLAISGSIKIFMFELRAPFAVHMVPVLLYAAALATRIGNAFIL